jgi:hypothetical protein
MELKKYLQEDKFTSNANLSKEQWDALFSL